MVRMVGIGRQSKTQNARGLTDSFLNSRFVLDN
jgi:hypothetical protein